MTPLDLKYTCREMLFMRNPCSVANCLLVSVYSCVQQAAVTEVRTYQFALAIHRRCMLTGLDMLSNLTSNVLGLT